MALLPSGNYVDPSLMFDVYGSVDQTGVVPRDGGVGGTVDATQARTATPGGASRFGGYSTRQGSTGSRYPDAGNIPVDPTGLYPNFPSGSRYPNAGDIPVDPTGLYPEGIGGGQGSAGTEDLPGTTTPKTGLATAPMSAADAQKILAGINPETGQYDPSIAGNAQLIAKARVAFGYDTPTGAAGPRTVGGTPTTPDTDFGGGPSPADLLGAPSARGQFTPGYQAGLTGTGDAPMGGQPLNERLYADEPTAGWLAQQLGGEVTGHMGAAYPGGQNPDMSAIRLPDGRVINAGELATYLGSQQTAYQQGVSNYQRNRGGEAPMTPIDRLRQSLEQDKIRWGTSGYETGQQFPQQELPAGYQRPPQFQRGDDFQAPGAGGGYGGAPGATQPAWQQPQYPGLPPQGGGQQPARPDIGFGGYGRIPGGRGQPINMGGYGGYGGFGQQGPAGFGGGLNFAMAPNSLYYPNMRGGGYAGLGGFPYTGGGMNFGGGFPGQQQYGGGGFGGGGFGGGYGQFQNPLMGFGNMGGFANFNNTTQNYMNQFQNRPQMGGQSGSWGNQGRNMYNRAPYF